MFSDFERMLKDSGLSLTSARKSVFEVLKSADSPLLPLEIYDKTEGLNLSSVYRSLEVFESLGVATKVSSGFKTRFELGEVFRPHRHRATCSSCGRSFELPEEKIEKLIQDMSRELKFKPTGHTFEITGKCKKC